MDNKLFTVTKVQYFVFLFMAWFLLILGFYAIGWGIYQGIKQNWEIVLTVAFSLPLVWGLALLCAYVAGHKED